MSAKYGFMQHRDIWVGNTGERIHHTNNIVEGHNVCKPPLVTTLGQHGTAATASKLVDICGQWRDHYRDELVPAYLTNVHYNPKSNLIWLVLDNLYNRVLLCLQMILAVSYFKGQCCYQG